MSPKKPIKDIRDQIREWQKEIYEISTKLYEAEELLIQQQWRLRKFNDRLDAYLRELPRKRRSVQSEMPS